VCSFARLVTDLTPLYNQPNVSSDLVATLRSAINITHELRQTLDDPAVASVLSAYQHGL
jgi:hypothetical protein